jgi:hypothetical protein
VVVAVIGPRGIDLIGVADPRAVIAKIAAATATSEMMVIVYAGRLLLRVLSFR